MANIFKTIRVKPPKRNSFNMSHEVKTTIQCGNLTPIFCQEVVPGDTFHLQTQYLIRAMPLIAPIMHRVNVYCHFFFVPNRLIWDKWEEFITGGPDGNSNLVPPHFSMSSFFPADYPKLCGPGSLLDHLGYPVLQSQHEADSFLGVPSSDRDDTDPSMWVSALPVRAFLQIFNDYYRDENVEDPLEFSKSNTYIGSNELQRLCQMRQRAWEKDYFTSALPWPQRGGSASVPLGDASIDVVFGNPRRPPVFRYSNSVGGASPSTILGDIRQVEFNNGVQPQLGIAAGPDNPTLLTSGAVYDPHGTLALNDATIDITELRKASKIQQWLERNARGGSRYIEQIFSHFGVRSSDARLQRAEFLGGGRSPIMIDDVLQTSASEPGANGSPQANMAGRGMAVNSLPVFHKFFEEHGYVIGIMSIIPKPTYQQGCPRSLRRWDKTDYYFPEFARIGEQEIKNSEIYFNWRQIDKSVANTNDAEFGYTPRYAEYKYIPSSVHGDLRSSLSFWHLGRQFSSQPHLNQTFVSVFPNDMNNVFATDADKNDQFVVQIYHNFIAKRPMPKYGTPSL